AAVDDEEVATAERGLQIGALHHPGVVIARWLRFIGGRRDRFRQLERVEVITDVDGVAGMTDRGQRHALVNRPDLDPAGGLYRDLVLAVRFPLARGLHAANEEFLSDFDPVRGPGVD